MNSPTREITRRSLLGLGAVGLSAIALAGCSTPATSTASGAATPSFGGDIHMSMFGSATRQKKIQQVFDLYTKKYGGSVNLEILANDAYAQKLATEVAGGAAADVIGLFHNLVADYARRGAFASLDDYVPKIIDITGFDQAAITGGVIDGKRVALPLGDNAFGVIYDKELLESIGMKVPEPGYSWDDFVSFSNDVSKKKGDGYFGTMDDSGDLNGFEIFIRQRGKSLYKAGKLGFQKSDLEAWYELWAELRKSGGAPPGDLTVETASGGFGNSLLVAGKAANFFIYTNVLSSFQALTKSALGLTTLPIDDTSKSGHYVRASNWVGAYSHGSHVDDAANLIQFILNDKDAGDILQAEFGAPPNLKLRKSIAFNDVDKLFVDYVDLVAKDFAQPVPTLADEFPPGSPQIITAFLTISQSIATGNESISAGVDDFFTQATGFLA